MIASSKIATRFYVVFLIMISVFFAETVTYAAEPGKLKLARPIIVAALIEDEKNLRASSLDARVPEIDHSSWALYLDNDIFALDQNDRDYTGGMSLTLSGANAATQTLSIDSGLDVLNGWFGIGKLSDKTLHSFEIGMTAFTPENKLASEVQQGDRPYASLLYVSNTRQYVDMQHKSSIITSLTFGVLGLDVAAEVQNKIHQAVGSNQAQGWNHQISEGGELTFRYSIAKQKVQWASYSRANLNYEIKTASSISLGYLTEASWSVSGRLGKLRSPWSSFNPQNVAYAEKNLPLADVNNTPKSEFYVWAGLSVHARAYNVLLQGQFRNSNITYSSSELEHLVNEAWIGVTKELDNGVRLSYFLRGQSAEIKTGPGSRNPVWGGIIISRSVS